MEWLPLYRAQEARRLIDDEGLHREGLPIYRCSRREKYGKDQCAARPLPAAALEEFVVARISDATADGSLAKRVAAHLETLTAGKGENLAELRATLATRIAEASTAASKGGRRRDQGGHAASS